MIKPILQGRTVIAVLQGVVEREGDYGPFLFWEFKDGTKKYVGFTESEIIEGNKLWVLLTGFGVTKEELMVSKTIDLDKFKGQKFTLYLQEKRDVFKYAVIYVEPSIHANPDIEKEGPAMKPNKITPVEIKNKQLTIDDVNKLFT
jgi:hypothetical protein